MNSSHIEYMGILKNAKSGMDFLHNLEQFKKENGMIKDKTITNESEINSVVKGIMSGKSIRDLIMNEALHGACLCGDTGIVGSKCRSCGEEIVDTDTNTHSTDDEEYWDDKANRQADKDKDYVEAEKRKEDPTAQHWKGQR